MKLIVFILLVFTTNSYALNYGQKVQCPKSIDEEHFRYKNEGEKNCRLTHDGQFVFRINFPRRFVKADVMGEIITELGIEIPYDIFPNEVIVFQNGSFASLEVGDDGTVEQIYFYNKKNEGVSRFVWFEDGRNINLPSSLLLAKGNKLEIIISEEQHLLIDPNIDKIKLEKSYQLETFINENEYYYDVDYNFANTYIPLYFEKLSRDLKCEKRSCLRKSRRILIRSLEEAGLSKDDYREAYRYIDYLNVYTYEQLYSDNDLTFNLFDDFYTITNKNRIITHYCQYNCSSTVVQFLNNDKLGLNPNIMIQDNDELERNIWEGPL